MNATAIVPPNRSDEDGEERPAEDDVLAGDLGGVLDGLGHQAHRIEGHGDEEMGQVGPRGVEQHAGTERARLPPELTRRATGTPRREARPPRRRTCRTFRGRTGERSPGGVPACRGRSAVRSPARRARPAASAPAPRVVGGSAARAPRSAAASRRTRSEKRRAPAQSGCRSLPPSRPAAAPLPPHRR